MKRVLAAACLMLLVLGSSAHGATTSQTGAYTGGLFFAEDCDLGLGVVCFSIFETGLTSVHIDVDDVWPFPVTAHAEVFGPGGAPVTGTEQFCESTDIALPQGAQVAQIVVHVGGFMEDGCGPIPFMDPFEGRSGSFTPAVAGTVTISY